MFGARCWGAHSVRSGCLGQVPIRSYGAAGPDAEVGSKSAVSDRRGKGGFEPTGLAEPAHGTIGRSWCDSRLAARAHPLRHDGLLDDLAFGRDCRRDSDADGQICARRSVVGDLCEGGPGAGYALQLVFAVWFELEARSGGEVDNGA